MRNQAALGTTGFRCRAGRRCSRELVKGLALAPFLIEQGLLSLIERYPRLRLEVHGANRRLDLATGEADLALRLDPLKSAALRARCIIRSAVALYASRTSLGTRTVRSAAQLKGHRVLLPAGELAGLPEGRWLAGQPGVNCAFASNSLPALIAAAQRGHGIVALTSAWGDRESALVRLFDVLKLPARALWLVSTQAGSKRPAVMVVATALSGIFARTP
jgi:hypothetical protein